MSDRHIEPGRYLRGRLGDAERQRAEEHLGGCERCRGAVEAARGRAAAETERARARRFRVFRPRFLSRLHRAVSFLGRFGAVVGLTGAVLLLPAPAGLSAEGHRALAAFVFTATVLALEPVSLPIAALMVPAALVALGVASTNQAFASFSAPVVFLILASLFLAEALRKHRLTRRLALITIVASGGGMGRLLFGLMGIAALFAMWVGNTATAAMLLPVALTISKQAEDPAEANRLLVLLALGVAYSASLGGMATIMGASANAVASGFLAQVGRWTFLDWMRYGLPSFLLIFPLTGWLLLRVIPLSLERLDVEPARRQVAEMGRMKRTEVEVLVLLGVAACLWIGGPSLERLLGLHPTLLSAAMVAVLAVSYLAVRRIITWEDLKGVSWGIFLIIGAGLSLGEALTRAGVTEWFAGRLGPWIGGVPFVVSLFALVLLSALLTNLLNNTTIAAVFVPILIHMAQDGASFQAVQLVLPVTLATTFGYSLPSASGRMALLSATGIVERGEMLRYGLLFTVVSSLVLAGFFYLLVLVGWI